MTGRSGAGEDCRTTGSGPAAESALLAEGALKDDVALFAERALVAEGALKDDVALPVEGALTADGAVEGE
ncbi:hypothetical protein [Crystallibacter crystallopoietes]|uniref:hypothetical protein n=1 Tax=Crystallibacter crystallopoietes TaxID=37928 RepID=UPI00123748E6|nr:hypothetical protein [Arthrobacter crystallopoietes]